MNLYSQIVFADPKGIIRKQLELEHVKGSRNDRAQTQLAAQKGKTVVSFEAKDATALRAALNSVVKLLCVYEKAQEIK